MAKQADECSKMQYGPILYIYPPVAADMEEEKMIQSLAGELGLTVQGHDPALYKQALIDRINELLQTDFPKLVAMLYRMDVSETKLKALLKENPDTDAGAIITELIIERQLQKIKSRSQSGQQDPSISEDEEW